MKKTLIFTIAVMLAMQFSMAQTQKGAQNLGGYVGYSRVSSNDSQIIPYNGQTSVQKNNTSSFDIGPAYGYFVADNLELRGVLQFSTANFSSSYATSGSNGDSKQKSNTFGGSLALMKYVMSSKIGLRVGPYIGYSYGVTKTNNPATSPTATSHVNSYNAGAKADLVYYPSKTLGFAASLVNINYSKSKSQDVNIPERNTTNEFFNASFITNGLGLSVFYVFGNK
ncbi:hypothetical protein ACFQZS_13685 [Mucilaginibacter calamicampi]|uniref:Outer membrane protein beta-barrel domain-containing protein n=1 Tax=Mucilaginibacter calamicampi TaxID=1302352 RepID=A0ABW2Z0F9_9SPHI